MTQETTSKIATWLAKCNLDKGGFGSSGGGIVLKSRIPATKATELVQEYPINHETDIQHVAQQVALDAHMDAQGEGNGAHHYTLFAVRDGSSEHFARLPFIVLIDSPEAIVDEEATAKGMLAQNQRHLEALMRIHTQGMPTLMHGYHSVLQTLSSRLESYEKTHVEVLNMLRDVVKQSAELEIDAMSKIKSQERIDKAIEILGPVLVPKVLEMLTPQAAAEVAGALGSGLPGGTPGT